MKRLALLMACAGLTVLANPLSGQNLGQPVPDFPPGLATDGKSYRLADFKGKVVVLYFFESQ